MFFIRTISSLNISRGMNSWVLKSFLCEPNFVRAINPFMNNNPVTRAQQFDGQFAQHDSCMLFQVGVLNNL